MSILRPPRSIPALLLLASFVACDDPPSRGPDDETVAELAAGPPLGKADNAGVAGLPVHGDYAATRAWEVENRWEDTETPAAREAGPAWPADSGLSWDEKYARWIDSLPTTEGLDGPTLAVTTPWGKSLPVAKLDCADLALALRASFAAWYRLPFYVVAFDGSTPVYFGHFGIRTATGRWKNMPKFAVAYDDWSDLGAEALEDWPRDEGLRCLGVQSGDEQPFLGPHARTGAWLDEIHLDKRAARFIRLLLVYNGSGNLTDARNTFNVSPEAIQPGDVNLHRWQMHGIGHTMLTTDVDEREDGRLEVRVAESSLPPIQARRLDPVGSALRLTSPYAGGADETEDYAPYRGGLKRFRVTKNIGGKWTNTWMAADEAAWIDSNDLDALRERPSTFAGLLGEADPEEEIAALLAVVEAKREHLRDHPASCAARSAREEAFAAIYEVAAEAFGMSPAQVDGQWRIDDDYIFAELVYDQSKTCCWNSTTPAMYEAIVDYNAQRQAQAQACLPPVVFKATDGGYDAFAAHDPAVWKAWSADEPCPQAGVHDDVEAPAAAQDYCSWLAGDADPPGATAASSCEGHCGGQAETCWCDEVCADYGDCCDDRNEVCE